MILSLFSGCGALDLGFEQAGFETSLAYDIRPFAVATWNHNRPKNQVANVADITKLSLGDMDKDFGQTFCPKGVIGGPPCQSFSRANSSKKENDPREKLVGRFFEIALELHERSPLQFIMMENVQELSNSTYGSILNEQIELLVDAGFSVHWEKLDAVNYGVPQFRKRLILVAYNSNCFPELQWSPPPGTSFVYDVKSAIGSLEAPAFFERNLSVEQIPVHPNHWCMKPKSKKFHDGSLGPGIKFGRSFKTLSWDKPSYTVSYGNREVHVHPSGKRRLSVYEAMLLQGFPQSFVITGNLSQQITQVSEAVPPPLAKSIACGIKDAISSF